MITARRQQLGFADTWIQDTVDDLWEPWMKHADQALTSDAALLDVVARELNKRCQKSKTRGRPAYTAEVVVRILLLKHLRDMSFATVAREVRGNLVYRQFTGMGGGAVPDEKTLGRVSRQLGPESMAKIQERMVAIAREQGVATGRKMRLDTTVVETNIHYPTDSKLLNDGVRVLTREMKRLAQTVGTAVRDRSRSVKLKVLAIARATRDKSQRGQTKMATAYGQLLEVTGRVVGQAKQMVQDAAALVNPNGAAVQAQQQLERVIPLMEKVRQQTRARVLGGNTRVPGKIVSLFEPHTEVIRKGKASKPTEFGLLVLLCEAENQIVTRYQVCVDRPADSQLLIPALENHIQQFERAPRVLAADAGFFSAANEKQAKALGVQQVSIPHRATKSVERRKTQKLRWFKKAQKWRTGCEGRISVLKRRHGLGRCRYKGISGMERWVSWGVIADNFTNIGCFLAAKGAP